MIREAIAAVVAGRDLSEADAAAVMEELMSESATPSQAAALLIGLRMKGETVDEITGMVRVMRAKALPLTVEGDVLDVVSTGGGSFDPFNISTAAALVCAGAGLQVAKHGNRGFTSASGAADVLEALGARLELTPEQVAACIRQTRFGFLFAQAFHPAMRFVAPTRREIGVRTIFNSLGPLTNPAGARYHLMGVGAAALAEKVAAVLARLSTGRSLVVHGEDGLDEVTLGGSTRVYEVRGSEVSSYSMTPQDAGLEPVPLEAVRTGTAADNARRMRALLAGEAGADRQYTLINAAAALMTAGKAASLKDGVMLARESIDSGAAARTLDSYVAATQSFAG